MYIEDLIQELKNRQIYNEWQVAEVIETLNNLTQNYDVNSTRNVLDSLVKFQIFNPNVDMFEFLTKLYKLTNPKEQIKDILE